MKVKSVGSPFDLQAVVNAIPGNHVLLLPDAPAFTIMGVTDTFLQTSYTTREQILGRSLFEIFPDNTTGGRAAGVANLLASLNHVLAHKEVHQMADQQYDIINPHTGAFEFKVWAASNTPVLDADGAVQCIIHTTEDITDRIKAEQLEEERSALSGANAYLQKIIDVFNAPLQVLEPIFVEDRIVDFRFKMTNAAYAAYAHTTPEALQNKKVGEVFPGYFQTSSFTKIVDTYQTGIADTWEIHYKGDGLDIYNVMSATKLGEEVVVHFTEYTKLKTLQLELEKKVMELERSNKNLEEFAYAASHDLKEPIRKIHFFSDRLKERLGNKLEEEDRRYFARMEIGTTRMASLIDDLLLYSHVSRGIHSNERVDLNQTLSYVLDDLELHIEEKGARVKAGTLPAIKGHPRQLQQLFENLIANALKYAKPDQAPQVEITARLVNGKDTGLPLGAAEESKQYHLVEVRDNGIGFGSEDAERIFNVFTRLHGNSEYKGTGVGLSIARKVAENHGGHIWAESVPGEGAAFKVLLPVE